MAFTPLIQERMHTLARLAGGELNGYNSQAAWNKEQYLKTGRSVLRAIAEHLNMKESKVNINRAGPAVSGDITLMSLSHNGKGVYICMSMPMLYGKPAHFYYRLVTHMKDYSGSGINQTMTYKQLADDPIGACEVFAKEYKRMQL